MNLFIIGFGGGIVVTIVCIVTLARYGVTQFSARDRRIVRVW